MEFINQYFGLIGVVTGFVFYLIAHRELALNKAKQVIREFIFLAEKRSRELLLQTGIDKKQWVLQNGYAHLPKVVSLVISKDLFNKLVQDVFDRTLGIIDKRNHPNN